MPTICFSQNVLFVTNVSNIDQTHRYLRDYCQSNGYTINITAPSSPSLNDLYQISDIVIIGPQTKGDPDTIAAFNSVVGANPYKPLIICKGDYMVSYKMVSRAGFNSKDGYQMTINPELTEDFLPLTAGKAGAIEVYDFPQGVEAATGNNDKNVYVLRKTEIAPSAIIVATNTNNENYVPYCAFESGSIMLDEVTKANNRLVAFYFAVWTNVAVCVYNTNTDDLFTAAFDWAIAGIPSEPNSVKQLGSDHRDYKIIGNNLIQWINSQKEIMVFNLFGKEVYKVYYLENNQLDLSILTPGIYMVRSEDSESGKITTIKFINK